MAGFKVCLEELIKRQAQGKAAEKMESIIFVKIGAPAQVVGPPPMSIQGAILKRKTEGRC